MIRLGQQGRGSRFVQGGWKSASSRVPTNLLSRGCVGFGVRLWRQALASSNGSRNSRMVDGLNGLAGLVLGKFPQPRQNGGRLPWPRRVPKSKLC